MRNIILYTYKSQFTNATFAFVFFLLVSPKLNHLLFVHLSSIVWITRPQVTSVLFYNVLPHSDQLRPQISHISILVPVSRQTKQLCYLTKPTSYFAELATTLKRRF